MPVDEDKYPAETGRRRFVKGVVGSAALSGAAASGALMVNSATGPTGGGGGPTEFVGIERVDGPAPRGMPIVPIEVNEENQLVGKWPETKEVEQEGRTVTVAEEDVGGVTYSSSWFQYCGIQEFYATRPTADADNVIRVTSGSYDWTGDLEAGEPYTVSDFDDYEEWGNGIGEAGIGKPGPAEWRTNDEGQAMPVQVLRSTEVSRMANGEGEYSSLPGNVQSFIAEATDQDFMAWLNKCTHFCCVPGFKSQEGSAQFGGANSVYCQCHQSIYEPFSPIVEQYIALPRPE